MAEFSYKGRSSDGKLVNGRAAGDSVDQVAQRLIATGVIPLQIDAMGVVARSIDLEKLGRRIWGSAGVTTTDLVMFSRQMYTITRAGIPLLRGLRGLIASTHNALLRETLAGHAREPRRRPRPRREFRAASEDLPHAVREHRQRW